MGKQEVFSTNKALRFDGSNYTFWAIRMEVYLQSLKVDMWNSVVNGYTNHETTPVVPTDIRLYE